MRINRLKLPIIIFTLIISSKVASNDQAVNVSNLPSNINSSDMKLKGGVADFEPIIDADKENLDWLNEWKKELRNSNPTPVELSPIILEQFGKLPQDGFYSRPPNQYEAEDIQQILSDSSRSTTQTLNDLNVYLIKNSETSSEPLAVRLGMGASHGPLSVTESLKPEDQAKNLQRAILTLTGHVETLIERVDKLESELKKGTN